MLTITKPAPDRVEILLSGRLDGEAMRNGLDELFALSEDVTSGVMLYRISDLKMPDLGAIAVEFARLPKLFALLRKFDKCAVLADEAWLRKAAEIEGMILPGFEIRSFALSEEDAANAWLAAG